MVKREEISRELDVRAFDLLGLMTNLRKRYSQAPLDSHYLVIWVKDVKRVRQDRLQDLRLPPGVSSITPAHHRRPKYDREIPHVHLVGIAVHGDAVKMQHKHAEGGVVGIRQGVDVLM